MQWHAARRMIRICYAWLRGFRGWTSWDARSEGWPGCSSGRNLTLQWRAHRGIGWQRGIGVGVWGSPYVPVVCCTQPRDTTRGETVQGPKPRRELRPPTAQPLALSRLLGFGPRHRTAPQHEDEQGRGRARAKVG